MASPGRETGAGSPDGKKENTEMRDLQDDELAFVYGAAGGGKKKKKKKKARKGSNSNSRSAASRGGSRS